MSKETSWLKEDLIPASERHIPYQIAAPWFEVSKQSLQLEGLCFDRKGDLYFVEVFGGTVFKLTLPQMTLQTVCSLAGENPAALKIHQDGRLFVTCLGDFASTGSVVALTPDGKQQETVIDKSQGYVVDDLVFDRQGGFYFTDFKGYSCNPTGGVYYVSPEQKITRVMGNLAVPNGIALNPEQNALWVTEMSNNRLHYWELADDGVTIPAFGSCVPYHFTGLEGPDSCCIDAEGNLYVAMYMQGRVLVFNKHGLPVQQILLPERNDGHMLRSTHPMIIPGTDELVICSNDGAGDGGSWLYKAKALGQGYQSYQFLCEKKRLGD